MYLSPLLGFIVRLHSGVDLCVCSVASSPPRVTLSHTRKGKDMSPPDARSVIGVNITLKGPPCACCLMIMIIINAIEEKSWPSLSLWVQ